MSGSMTIASKLRLAFSLVALGALGTGCIAASEAEIEEEEALAAEEEALFAGVNGKACARSPFNCKLRVEGGNAIDNSKGEELWGVEHDYIVDGNGDPMIMNTWNHLRFNYGQDRRMNGRTYVYARSSSNGSSGWFPIDKVKGESSLRKRVGEVNAKDPKQGKMACYEIRDSHSETLAAKKVVYDAQTDNERAGDYLPLPRKNGRRYSNLAFSVPGSALGAPAVDIFPSGTKFQRVDVPTKSGKPSLDVPLWVDNGKGRYTQRSGSLKFVYGYVVAKDGTKRFGWMALSALTKSTGCK